ncbi:DUF2521 family protein [Geomicrobium sp. JCM 19039]|uniref:DUF2521 family protein n=1 Tax=Geomicrobium sp. JCM 19039 TaxID=1460636 RepID=UPI00045F30ED|nr:DUF2521 family protein [Geomicrobium sp. JCM 19039]GAK13793.1 hypothetical protein JCM19039_3670 [Geomicrobium sp. JCM 19039]
MGAVVSFQEEKRARDWETEKSLLHTLSMEDMVAATEKYLVPISRTFRFRHSFLEEVCMDLAIETFLYSGKRGMTEARLGKAVPHEDAHLQNRMMELNLFISDWIQDQTVESEKVAHGAAAM